MAKRKIRPGALILADNVVNEEIYTNKTPVNCTNLECRNKIREGDSCIAIYYRRNGRLICRFCSSRCQEVDKINMRLGLESCGD